MKYYSEKARLIKKQKHITSSYLAKHLGVSPRTIYAWENGQNTPSQSDVRILAQLLDVSADEISDLKDLPGDRVNSTSDFRFSANIDKNIALMDEGIKELGVDCPTSLIEPVLNLKSQTRKLSSENFRLKLEWERLTAVFNSLDNLIYIKDAELKIKNINNAFADRLGKIKENIIGRKFPDFFGSSDQGLIDVIKLELEVFSTGISIIDRKIYIPGSYSQKTGIISIIPLTGKATTATEIVCSIKDITTEATLQRNREQLEAIINNLEDAVFIIDLEPAPHFIFLGNGAMEVYGRSPSEFYSNKNLRKEILHPEDKKRVMDEWENALKNNLYPLKQEYRITHKDGSTRHVESISFKDNERNIIFGRLSDITERKNVSEKINFLNKVINDLEDVVWIRTDDKDNFSFVYINNAVKSVFNESKEVFYKDPKHLSSMLHPDDKDQIMKWWDSINIPGYEKIKTETYRIIDKNHNIKWIEDTQYNSAYWQGIKTRLGIIKDITDVKNGLDKIHLLEYFIDKLDFLVWIFAYNDKERNFNFIYINDAVETIFGESKETFYKNPKHMHSMLHPEDKNRILRWWKMTNSPDLDKADKNTYRIIRNGGEIRWIQDVRYKATMRLGKKTVLGFVYDITKEINNNESKRKS